MNIQVHRITCVEKKNSESLTFFQKCLCKNKFYSVLVSFTLRRRITVEKEMQTSIFT